MDIAQSTFKFNIKNIIFALLFICIMLTGLIPQGIQAILFVGLLCILLFTDYFYLAYPIILFYYSHLGLLFGISVYRIFSLMYIFQAVVFSNNKYENKQSKELDGNNKNNYVLVLFVYLLYEIIVMTYYNIRTAIFSMVDVICVILFIKEISSIYDKFKKTFIVYGVTAIIAFFTGLIAKNDISGWQVINGELVKITRFMSTFNDPNYMGLFYSVAIFSIISLKLFDKKLRMIIIVALYIMLVTTISITAIIGNILFWIVYLFATKKINAKTLVSLVFIFMILGGLYQYGKQNRDTPVIGDLVYRIEDKLSNLANNDTDAFTTYRTTLTREHWNYYWSQSTLSILFGGNIVNGCVAVIDGQKTFVAHNEYVDSLLNVGLVGALILITFVLVRAYKSLKEYIKTKSEKALCIFMIKAIWMYYAATLTMFLEFRFMLFYLL